MAIRIIIADEADLLLLGAETVLGQEHRYRVVGQARCIDDLRTLVTEQQPDVVILGQWLYNVDLLSAVEQLQVLQPRLRLIVMGVVVDGMFIHELFTLGIAGYLYQSDDLRECLPQAVDTVMRDRPYLSPTANAEYLFALRSPESIVTLDDELRQVLRRLAHGEYPAEIAQAMDIDLRRFYWAREKLRQRFSARTNEHMMQRAAVQGFIFPHD